MLENAAPPLWKSSSPMTNSSMESIRHITHSSQPSSQPKNPPENVCTLPKNHYYMQTLVKICNLQQKQREIKLRKKNLKRDDGQ